MLIECYKRLNLLSLGTNCFQMKYSKLNLVAKINQFNLNNCLMRKGKVTWVLSFFFFNNQLQTNYEEDNE